MAQTDTPDTPEAVYTFVLQTRTGTSRGTRTVQIIAGRAAEALAKLEKLTSTRPFGAPEGPAAHRFEVTLAKSHNAPTTLHEVFAPDPRTGETPRIERARIDRALWKLLAPTVTRDFNERLKARKLPAGRWSTGTIALDHLLGKELCALVWAAEEATVDEAPVIVARWQALSPEERWLLFQLASRELGRADQGGKGWRRALYLALSYSPGRTEQ